MDHLVDRTELGLVAEGDLGQTPVPKGNLRQPVVAKESHGEYF